MAVLTYLQAISEGMREEMRRDEAVVLLGEDIGVYGGAFKVTKGFLDEFGPNRVIDTPISESAIVGAAVGMALYGFRPIAEIQFADFITVAYNQIVQNAATIHYRYGFPVPVVVRAPSGAGVHGGPFHSQNPEALFTHVAGLKVVAPSTPADAKGLIKAAVRDDNPVLYFEHKYLYRRIKAEVPEDDDLVVPIGVADVKRPGRDATVITYGSAVHTALAAADELSKEGAEVEVLDLRTLRPYDEQAILESVGRTNRVLVLHEASRTGGVGAEIAAFVSERAFEALDAPVMRLGGLDTPVPYSPPLEEYWLPSRDRVVDALRKLLAY